MVIAICDDSQEFCQELLSKIQEFIYHSEFTDIHYDYRCFSNPKSLIEYLYNHTIDILFLDISMPEINGFDIAQICQNHYPDICLIFISSYDKQVYYSIRFSPFRFLCKNNYKLDLPEALNSAFSKLLIKDEYLNISNYTTCTPIKISQIIHAAKEKQSNYINIHCLDECYRYRSTIHQLEEVLRPHGFIKINSGMILNLKYIIKIDNNTVTLSSGCKLPVSRQCRSMLIKEHIKYLRTR